MNIAQHVERAARWFPDHPAILFEGGALPYRELDTRASRLANALAAHGVGRGDRVALYLPNIPAFAVCYLAVLKVGAIAVSINAIFKSDEVKYIVNDSGATLIFTVGDLLPNVPLRDCPSVTQVVTCEGDTGGHASLADWIAKGASDGRAVDMHREDAAVLLYTSGTTGFPGKPDDTARALRGGWLHSGDIGTMDDEGYVFIVDRVKDMINVSGFKVWPAEVEHKGEAVKAAIVLKQGAAAPASVDFVTELPKSATGKILKRVLRDR